MSTRWIRKALTVSLIVGAGISLSGCMTGLCTGWGSIRPSKDDVLTEGTARQILKHNNYGLSLKCPAFKPKGGWLS